MWLVSHLTLLLLLLGASGLVVPAPVSGPSLKKKPDVLIIVSDDQGYSDVSW